MAGRRTGRRRDRDEGLGGGSSASNPDLPSFPIRQLAPPPVEDAEPEHAGEREGVQGVEEAPGRGVAAAGAQEHGGDRAGGPQDGGFLPETAEEESQQGGGWQEEDGEQRGREPRTPAEEPAQ